MTHLDTHMGSALAPEWCDRYVSLGTELGIPVLLTGTLGAYGPSNHLTGAGHAPYVEAVAVARAAGMPLFDEVLETDFARPGTSPPTTRRCWAASTRHSSTAPSIPTLRAARRSRPSSPTSAMCAPTSTSCSPQRPWKHWLESRPYTLTTMRELRDAWHARSS